MVRIMLEATDDGYNSKILYNLARNELGIDQNQSDLTNKLVWGTSFTIMTTGEPVVKIAVEHQYSKQSQNFQNFLS